MSCNSLTWMFFQQFKLGYERVFHRKPTNEVNFVLGALAAAGSVTVMIPMDTIKTRLVIQTTKHSHIAYKGVTDCLVRIIREEGVGTLYRALPPRLLAVVPMIAIQFGIYESIKSKFMAYNRRKQELTLKDNAVNPHQQIRKEFLPSILKPSILDKIIFSKPLFPSSNGVLYRMLSNNRPLSLTFSPSSMPILKSIK